MVESGASPEDIAKVMVQQKLLEAIGKSPEEMSKALLKSLRSGEDISKDELLQILQSGGIDVETGAKVVTFQKAMARCRISPQDLAAAIQLQKAMKEQGNSPEVIIQAIKELVGDKNCQMADDILLALKGSLETSDMEAFLQFGQCVEAGSLSKCAEVRSAASKESVSEAVKQVLPEVKPEAMAALQVLQKLLTSMDLPVDAVGKMVHLEKSMFDSGASMHDIAHIMEMILDSGGSNVLDPNVMEKLKAELSEEDLQCLNNMIEGFASAKLNPELTSRLMQLQAAVESGMVSPEKSAEEFLELLNSPNANSVKLKENFLNLMNANGITKDTLERGVMIQGAMTAAHLSAQDFQAVLELQNALLSAGMPSDQVSEAFQLLIGGVDLKNISKAMATSFDHKRMKEEDVAQAAVMAKVLENSKLKGIATKELMDRLKPGMTAQEVCSVLKDVLDTMGVTVEGAGKAVMIQTIMSDSQVDPIDLVKVLRVQKTLSEGGANLGNVVGTINDVLEPRNKDVIQTMKDLAAKPLHIKQSHIEFAKACSGAITANLQTAANMNKIFDNALAASGLSKEDIVKALMVQKTLAASGVSPEVMAQAVMFQKALAASGASPEEIVQILAKVCDPKYSDEQVAKLMAKALERKSSVTPEDLESLIKLQQSLRSGNLADNVNLEDLIAAGSVDMKVLEKAVLMQKVLTASGLSAEDLGKAVLVQQAMLDSGASPQNVTDCLKKTLLESAVSLEHLVTLMEIELKASGGMLSPEDIRNTLHFEKVLGAAGTAKLLSKKLSPESLKLLQAALQGDNGKSTVFNLSHSKTFLFFPVDSGALMEAMQGALGDSLDPATIQALEVSKLMSAAGASKEEIEEMMAMILNRGGAVSQEFIEAIKDVMLAGASGMYLFQQNYATKQCFTISHFQGSSPAQVLEMLRATVEEELNSTTNALRQIFMNKIPTQEDIEATCLDLAEKLCGGEDSKNDVKIALVDVLEEALQGIL